MLLASCLLGCGELGEVDSDSPDELSRDVLASSDRDGDGVVDVYDHCMDVANLSNRIDDLQSRSEHSLYDGLGRLKKACFGGACAGGGK